MLTASSLLRLNGRCFFRALSTSESDSESDSTRRDGFLAYASRPGDSVSGEEQKIQLGPFGQVLDAQLGGYITQAWAQTKVQPSLPKQGNPDSLSFVAHNHNFAGPTPARPMAKRVAVVAPARSEAPPAHLEETDSPNFASEVERRESTRRTAAIGAVALRRLGAKQLHVEAFPDVQASAEGIELALYKYQRKAVDDARGEKGATVSVELARPVVAEDGQALFDALDATVLEANEASFQVGKVYGQSQNWARSLETTPANLLTPTSFCDVVEQRFRDVKQTTLFIRDEHWLKSEGMGGVLGVAQGSEEPPRLLELHYRGASDPEAAPLVLVGKGVTHDTGGISIKSAGGMETMKADMSGAAVVAAAVHGIARLKLPLNVVAVAPLVENMPSGRAIKPGDVLTMYNGKTVEVLNTDAEGRLILADALAYSTRKYSPHTIIDVATLTGAMSVALGDSFIGLWTSSSALWQQLRCAGLLTGDRFWRMPLDQTYQDAMQGGSVSDYQNITKKSKAGSCTAAAFLREFVPADMQRWAHLDIAGVMESSGTVPYEPKGMSGKPVRALIEFASRLDNPQS